MNLCTTCGEDFTGTRDFDSHRVGTHAYTFVEGMRMDPSREDGRRCLDASEMRATGWAKDIHGRWRRRQRKVSLALRGATQESLKESG